jgi:hypothetical protein
MKRLAVSARQTLASSTGVLAPDWSADTGEIETPSVAPRQTAANTIRIVVTPVASAYCNLLSGSAPDTHTIRPASAV